MITIALPLYKAKNIAWLALESLCNQIGSPPFELIIYEEVSGSLGEQYIRDTYGVRLSRAGCKEIKYFSSIDHVPLSEKWRIMGYYAHGDVFLLQAADCYSQPYRHKETYNLYKKGAEWIHSEIGYFYNIQMQRVVEYRHPNTHPTGLNMAFSGDLARKLPYKLLNKSVDRWLYNSCAQILERSPITVVNTSENWKKGVDTDGKNHISKNRKSRIAKLKEPFHKTETKIQDILPQLIIDRL